MLRKNDQLAQFIAKISQRRLQPRDARPAKNNFFDFNAKKSAIMRVLKC